MKVDPRSRRSSWRPTARCVAGRRRRTARSRPAGEDRVDDGVEVGSLQGGEVDETDAPLRLQRQVPVRSASAIGVTGWRLITG